MTKRLVDLSHVITEGMETYPGLPTPHIVDHLGREAAELVYGPGLTFQIGLVTMCTNTGTYLDVPFHRFADGHDLSRLALERVASVPAVCLDRVEMARAGAGAIELAAGDLVGLEGHAVLVRTDHSRRWGTDAYFSDHPFLTQAAALALVAARVACVGIDSLNIDSTRTGDRPVHTALLGAEVPIIEHLTGLDQLPPSGFRFTAVPPKIEGAGTFTVRAFAELSAS
jgi:kynurenine formamidase